MIRTPATKKVYRKVKKTILIDSRDRDPRFTQTQYTIKLPRVYENVYSIALRSAEVPFSWYGFTQALGNTSLKIDVDSTGIQTITIPDGNYTYLTFPTALETALNAVYGTAVFAVTYSTTTNKLTITVGAGGSGITSFKLFFNPTSAPQVQSICDNSYVGPVTSTSTWWGLGYFMGFYRKDYTSSGTVPTIVSDFSAQFNPYNYINMELDFMNKQDETKLDARGNRVDGCFAKLPITVNSGDIFFFREWGCCNMNESIMSPPLPQLSQITVKWRFHDGTPISFNNVDHSFSLELTLLENNFDEYSSLDFAKL